MPFFGELLFRIGAFFEMRELHAAQHFRRLGVLDVTVLDDFNAVAPRVKKIQKISFQHRRAGGAGEIAHARAVIYDQPEMPRLVGVSLLDHDGGRLCRRSDDHRHEATMTAGAFVAEATITATEARLAA